LSYRLIRHADAKRILFLVDRSNLGKQAKLEFDKFTIAQTQRKFSAEYNVQHLTTNTLDVASRVCIATIQRVFSILKGDPDLDPDLDEQSAFELTGAEPVEVAFGHLPQNGTRQAAEAAISAAIQWQEETLRRQATKPQAAEYGEAEMSAWYRELDLLPGGIDHVVSAETSLGDTVQLVMGGTRTREPASAISVCSPGASAEARRTSPQRCA
jgi:hypothetical protein